MVVVVDDVVYVLDVALLDGVMKVSGGSDESSEVRINEDQHTDQQDRRRARGEDGPRSVGPVRGIVVVRHAGMLAAGVQLVLEDLGAVLLPAVGGHRLVQSQRRSVRSRSSP